MVLKSSPTPQATQEHPQFTANELQIAEVYAANAVQASYLPRTAEDLKTFRPHRWVVEAIASAMYDLRHGLQPVLDQPDARHVPTEAVSEHIALVAEGRDLGMLTESRMTTDPAAAVYARAAIKVLDEAVETAYHVSPYNVTPQTEPMADTIQPPEDMTAFKEYTPQQVTDAGRLQSGGKAY